MTDIVTVGSPIEGGMSVDLDEVRATARADQWKHTDLLCGLVDHLRDELARTTGDLAVACEVARERGGTSSAMAADRLASAATVFLGEWRRGDDSITAGMAADLEDAIAEWGDAADAHRSVSVTNPDGFVAAQVAETTGLLRSLWLEHHVAVMKLGGPVTDPAASFDAWLAAVSGGGHR